MLERAGRSTRGKRMHTLIGEELDADEQFWNQDAFADDEEDEDFQDNEPEPEDQIDSDFDKPEEVEDQPAEEVQRERRTRTNRAYHDSAARKTTARPKKTPSRPAGEHQANENVPEPFNKTLRRSTKMASEEAMKKKQRRDQVNAERLEKKRERGELRVEERELTQEELMDEAKQTELINHESYLELVRLEEERRREPPKKEIVSGSPRLLFRSRDGKQTLSFSENNIPAQYTAQKAPDADAPKKEQPKCAITGLPAKYKDPKTGSFYANIGAFKILRARLETGGSEEKQEGAAGSDDQPSVSKEAHHSNSEAGKGVQSPSKAVQPSEIAT